MFCVVKKYELNIRLDRIKMNKIVEAIYYFKWLFVIPISNKILTSLSTYVNWKIPMASFTHRTIIDNEDDDV